MLASTHTSYYDIPLLIYHLHRPIDFLATAELFSTPLKRWFLRSVNAFPYSRARPDPAGLHTMVHRLRKGRAVCIFPEGGIRRAEKSVLEEGNVRRGFGRLAGLAAAPVVPVLVVNSQAYDHGSVWLGWKRARYSVCFCPPMQPPPPNDSDAAKRFESDFVASVRSNYQRLEMRLPRD